MIFANEFAVAPVMHLLVKLGRIVKGRIRASPCLLNLLLGDRVVSTYLHILWRRLVSAQLANLIAVCVVAVSISLIHSVHTVFLACPT